MRASGIVTPRLIGPALRTEREHGQLLPTWLALPVFCSNPISSVAYAPEQILLIVGLGGAASVELGTLGAAAVAVLHFEPRVMVPSVPYPLRPIPGPEPADDPGYDQAVRG
ncbi:hypothetical protein ACFYSW_28880 [Rhodococcus aetherivorans]|uniref:hypothetical protein n=1 Tax=Rhodococcus aetherivorans TaxID=191292 RepID=UPI00368DC0E0